MITSKLTGEFWERTLSTARANVGRPIVVMIVENTIFELLFIIKVGDAGFADHVE
jgi:hypothetical protein